MGLLQELFRIHGPAYLDRFGSAMPKAHQKVIAAIADCPTEAAGSTLYVCETCGQRHVVHRSCGNRHCPCCQQGKGHAWLERHRARQLPSEHFMLHLHRARTTAPLPASASDDRLRGAVRGLGGSDQDLGCGLPAHRRGYAGLLGGFAHLGPRLPVFRPHISYVVVGGALSSADGRWHPARAGFYLPVRALSRIVRAKFRDQIDKRGLRRDIPPEVWVVEWNVNCQPAGDGSGARQYLAPYVFKVAIGEHRIQAVDAHDVRFRYQKPHSNRVRTMTLPIMEFMRRFLQHVLPRGFMKVRYYGFLSPQRFGAPGGRQSPYRDGQRVCADGPREHQRASGGPALSSVRRCPAVLPPAPARRLRDRLPRRAGPAARRVVRPQRRAGRSLIRAARPAASAHRECSAGSEAPGAPSLTRSRDAHGPARPRSARHHAPSTSGRSPWPHRVRRRA